MSAGNKTNAGTTHIGRRELLTLVAMSPLLWPDRATADEAYAAVQASVTDFVRRGNVDGMSVAVIRDGRMRFYNAGVSVRDGDIPVTEFSVYEIGSISKTFTGLLLAHAFIEGRASQSDDVRQYLPPGYDNLQRDDRPIRLIDLVDTTSALPDNLPDWRKVVADANAQPA